MTAACSIVQDRMQDVGEVRSRLRSLGIVSTKGKVGNVCAQDAQVHSLWSLVRSARDFVFTRREATECFPRKSEERERLLPDRRFDTECR